MRLRDFRDDDVADGLRLSRAAGWNQQEEDWRTLLVLNPGRFVAAELDGRVIGTGGAAVYGTALAWICMILVEPGHRGAGLGTRLVEAALARCGDAARIGLDATPQGEPVYTRLGFGAEETILRLSLAAEARPSQARRSPAARRASAPLPAGLLREDASVFGADRGPVLRWLATHGRLFLVGPSERPEGYTLVRAGEHSWHMGPVVARDAGVAEALLAEVLLETPPGPIIVDARADERDWRTCLERRGFVAKRRLTRMYRSPGRPPAHGMAQLAIVGPEFG